MMTKFFSLTRTLSLFYSRDNKQTINIRTFLNSHNITSLYINYIELVSRYIFNIKVYQFLSIVFIYVVIIPIQIDWSLYTEVLNNLSVNLGSLGAGSKYIKLNSNLNYILSYSHRSLFGFKTYILMVLILFIIFPIFFIIQNYIFIILSILSAILVKALALNFYKKHFQFFYSGVFSASHKKVDFREKLVHFITQIINNIGKIIKHLFKMWIISIIIIFIFRYLIATMLLNIDDNNSFIITILILTLPLPMFFYLLNFIVKYLKKESIEDKDYYLYNDYVVERVNLYRITYTIIVNYIIKNYISTIIISIIIKGFIIIIITFFTIYILYRILQRNKPGRSRVDPLSQESLAWNKHEPIRLKSAFDTTSATFLAAVVSLTPFLQEACNTGFAKYYLNEGNARYYDWRTVPYSKPGYIANGRTSNILENRKLEKFLTNKAESEQQRNIKEFKDKLKNSPVINISWRLKYNEGVQRSKDNFRIRPISYFYNPKFYGTVCLMLKGRFLIVNIIRHDSPGCVFMPTYYLPNKNDPDSHAKISDVASTLEYKYGISMPRPGVEKANNRTNGIIIFTQAESIDNKSLFKVWRPSLNYTEPELKTIKNYYQDKSRNNLRIKEFDTVDSSRLSKDIEELVRIQEQAIKIVEKDTIVIHKDRHAASKLAYFEYILDKEYKKLVEFYLTKGQKANPDVFTMLPEDRSDKDRLKFEGLLNKVRDETKLSIEEDQYLLHKKKEHWVKLMEKLWNKHTSNNDYPDNDCYYFKTRRDYPINHILLTRDHSHMTYFSIYKNGVMEGYKDKYQMLGKLDSNFNLSLFESRRELIKKIASKLTSSEFTNFDRTYGVSINRLSFEFFEVKATDSEYFGVLSTNTFFEDVLDQNKDYELYSIIDIKNDSVKLPIYFKDGEWYKMTIPTHDYHMLDNRGELSIRRFMDFIYPNSDGELTYKSDKDNFSVLAVAPGDSSEKNYPYQSDMDNFSVVKKKSVGFTKQAVDYKNKKPKSVKLTLDAFNEKFFHGKSSITVELPFESKKLLDNIRYKYDKISLGGRRVHFDYEPGERVKSSRSKTLVMQKITNLDLDFRVLKHIYTTKGGNSEIKLTFTPTWPNGHEYIPNIILQQANLKNDSRYLNPKNLEALYVEYHLASRRPTPIIVLPNERPLITSGSNEEEEDLYGYSGDEDDNGKNNRGVASAVQAIEQPPILSTVLPNERPLITSGSNEEEEDLYGYSGDEDDNGKNNRGVASAVQASEQPPRVESFTELLEESLGDMPYLYDTESPKDNDNNSGSRKGRTAEASADQVVEGEEIALISADDLVSEGDLAFSPQFFIPESTPYSISSDNSSPINTQVNQEMVEILESNHLNRGEPMEIDENLYREVKKNAEGKAVVENINPILLLPDLPISNPEPVSTEDSPLSTEDSPLSVMPESEFNELEREIAASLTPSYLKAATGEVGFTEDSLLSTISDSQFIELERIIGSVKPSYLEAAPSEEDGSGQDAGEPEAIIISSDDSSSDWGDYDDSYSDREPSPITSLPRNRAGQMGEPEAIIISSDDSSSDLSDYGNSYSERGPTPPRDTDFIARPLNTPVAEVLDDRTGTRLLTVDINTVLAVFGPWHWREPEILSVGYENYFVSMASDYIYEHYPKDTELPENNYIRKSFVIYLPPCMDSVYCNEGFYMPLCRIYPGPHECGGEDICSCRPNFGEVRPLINYNRSSDIEGILFIKSVLSSEPLEDKDLSDRFNFSANSYTNAYFVPEPTPDTDSISSDNSSPINTQANQEEAGKSEVTLISADDLVSEGDLAFSPQFFIPESTPYSISSDNSSPINTQVNQEMVKILESNHLNRGDPMEIDEDLYQEVKKNAEGKAVVENINPILLLPDLPISNPEPVSTEDSPLSTEDSPLSMMSDSEFNALEQEITKLGKYIKSGKKGRK